MASIKRIGPRSYRVRVFISRDKTTGKTAYATRVVHGAKRDAETWAAKKERERDLGLLNDQSGATLADWILKWLREVKAHKLSPTTLEDYKAKIDRHIVTHKIGSKTLAQLKPGDLQAFYNELEAKKITRTIQILHAIINPALNHAVLLGVLPANPATPTKRPTHKRREPRILDAIELQAFLAAAQTHDLRALWLCAVVVGLRPEEYLGLQWTDVDFQSITLKVERALTWPAGGGWRFGSPKTPASRRLVHLPLMVVEALHAHQAKQFELQLQAKSWANHNLVFTSGVGTPIRPDNLRNRQFPALLKTAGLDENFTLYNLRHTAISHMLDGGMMPKLVSEVVGHTDVHFTMNTYQKLLEKRRAGAGDELQRIFGK